VAGALSGRAALVTGGASGIGAACVRRLAAEGAAVTVADLDEAAGRALVDDLAAAGIDAHFVRTDVTDDAACSAAIDAAAHRQGRLAITVAAAGISHGTYLTEPDAPNPKTGLLDVTADDWRRVMAVNVDGVLHTARAAARRMMSDGTKGSIITIASMNSQRTSVGTGPYSVSKAAAWMLTKSLAVELAPHGIRVNAVGPGFVETPMTARLFTPGSGARERALAGTPLGRLGQPEDIAAAVRFLAGDDAAFITGAILYADGGYLADVR
jgi:NAD(P)-dependent dehydrogenase (short-subunit alcohol dehydrogenase family)